MTSRTEPTVCPRVRRAVRWLVSNPGTAFYGSVALSLKWVMSDQVDTAATDGVHVFVNQSWADSLSRKKLRTACVHEIEHVINKHHIRIGDRPLKKANIAFDYAINGNQQAAGFEHWDGAYLDKRFKGLASETIYRILEDEERERQRKAEEERRKREEEERQKREQESKDDATDSDPDKGEDEDGDKDSGEDRDGAEEDDTDDEKDAEDGDDSDGDHTDEDDSEGDKDSDDEDEDGDDEEDDSEGNSGDDEDEQAEDRAEGGDGDSDPDEGDEEDGGDEDKDSDGEKDGDEDGDGKKLYSTFKGDMGGVIPFQGTPTELIAHERELNITISQAIGVARAANGGSTPGYLTELVEERAKPYVRWEDELAEFIDSPARVDYTWSRRSRYQLPSAKYVLQGTEPDGINRMIFVVDMSGSIDTPMFARFVAEGQAALDAGIVDRITFVYHDAEVKLDYVDDFVSGEIIVPRPPSRGGTKFSPVLEWITENASDAAGIVWFTDLLNETTDWLVCDDPGMPLLWCVYGKPWEYRPSVKDVKFGRIVELLN